MTLDPAPRSAYRRFLAIPTRWMDNDSYGHVNNVAYYAYFDTAVNEHLIRAGGLDIEGNPVRVESQSEAVALDRRLQALWSRHRDYTLVPHHPSFVRKLTLGLAAIQDRVAALAQR